MPALPVVWPRALAPLRAAREAGMVDRVTLEWVTLARNERGRPEPTGAVQVVATEPTLYVPVVPSTTRGGGPVGTGETGRLVLRLGTEAAPGMQALVRYTRSGVARQALVLVTDVEPERANDVIRYATVVVADQSP